MRNGWDIHGHELPPPKYEASRSWLNEHCTTGDLRMLTEFDKLVQQRAELERWWKLGETIAQKDNSYHVLRVDICKPSLVTYCGQAYSGAQNYHDAPAWFAECVRVEMQNRAKEIATAAYKAKLAQLNEEISKHRTAVEAELAKC